MRTIFFLLISISSFAQTPLNDVIWFPDTTNMAKGFVMIYPKPFVPQGEVRSDLLKFKWLHGVDLKLNTGGLLVYQPETDISVGANAKTMIRILGFHIPMNADIQPVEMKMLEDLVNNIRQDGIYVPPTTNPPAPVVTQIDGEKATFTGTWVHGPTDARTTGWYANTIAFSNSLGASVSYPFTGNKIELYAEKKPPTTNPLTSHGKGTVTITQGTTVIDFQEVSFSGTTTQLPALIYSKSLPAGSYTITLKQVSGYVLLDYYLVSQ